MTETQAIELFKKGQRGVFFKLHGNMFQSSLPDIIWIERGDVHFIEFKVVDGMTLGWSKCRLAQHLTMLKMVENGALVSYCVYSKKTEEFYLFSPKEVHEGQGTPLQAAWCY